MSTITWSDFEKVDIRTGTITKVEEFPEARNPAFKLYIDFGELGERKTSAQITKLYNKEELIGKRIIAVVNFPPKQIGKFMSECLVLGVVGADREVSLLTADHDLGNGLRVG
tara:strand:- start:922 stop:1257 length:336 start_codon:yes stop_codon:yes gene_type:complete